MNFVPVPFVVLVNKHDRRAEWEIHDQDLAALTQRGWPVIMSSQNRAGVSKRRSLRWPAPSRRHQNRHREPTGPMEPNVPSSAEDSLYSHLLGRFHIAVLEHIAETRFRLRRLAVLAGTPLSRSRAPGRRFRRCAPRCCTIFCMTPLRHGTLDNQIVRSGFWTERTAFDEP